MEARITFANGSEMTVEKNGDCYILPAQPDFPADLSIVTVESEEEVREYHNPQVTECASIDGRYWFALVEMSNEAAQTAALRARIAMLEDCLLEMSETVYA